MKTKHLKILEKYFNGEMTPAEMDSFEASLQLDPDLNASFLEYKLITEALGDRETMDLRGKLKDIKDEYKRAKFGRDFLSQNNNWIWLAALLTVVICFTIILSLFVSTENQRKRLAVFNGSRVTNQLSVLDLELMKYGIRNNHFKLESPKDSSIIDRGADLLFKWQIDSVLSLKLDIINRDGIVVHTTRKRIDSPYLLTKKFPEGFYVFRFRDERKSYYQGVMYLK